VNLPGTDRERPNWRRRLGVETNALWETLVGTATAQGLSPGRRAAGKQEMP
jgi:glycogen operon protein